MNGAANTLTYSGDTIIDAGILILNGNVRLPFGAGKGNLVINDGQFEMNGRDMSINGLYGAGNIQNRTSTKTLTLGNANADGDFSGVVSNTGGGGSTQLLNVTKVGSGTQIFSGFNTYGGITDVQAGTLVMASHAAAGFSSIQATGGVLRIDPGAGEALELFKTIAISGPANNPTGTIDVASGGFVALKSKGNTLSLASRLATSRQEHRQRTHQQLGRFESRLRPGRRRQRRPRPHELPRSRRHQRYADRRPRRAGRRQSRRPGRLRRPRHARRPLRYHGRHLGRRRLQRRQPRRLARPRPDRIAIRRDAGGVRRRLVARPRASCRCSATTTATASSTPPTTPSGATRSAKAAGTLANDPNFGVPIGDAQYATWKANFGILGGRRLGFQCERRRARAGDAGAANFRGGQHIHAAMQGV